MTTELDMILRTVDQLENLLTTPNDRDMAALEKMTGNILILGAGGKMGPSLAQRIRRAGELSGTSKKIIAVSKFSSTQTREDLEKSGVETISCDLMNRTDVDRLPDCENILYLAGRKFGSAERSDLTWASNTIAPAYIAHRYQNSRLVVFSTGNIYPFITPKSGGSIETDWPDPRGEYAQSCLGRERVFEYFSREYGTKCLIFRLNYAVDLRYGVIIDIAKNVMMGNSINLSVGYFNVIWQGDANSYALRSLALCESPPRILNVTGDGIYSVRETAEFFGRRFQRAVKYIGIESETSLLNNAAACFELLGKPEIDFSTLCEMAAVWIENGGVTLGKPTKFEVSDGRF